MVPDQPSRRLYGQGIHRPRTQALAQLAYERSSADDITDAQARDAIGLRERVQLKDITCRYGFGGRQQRSKCIVLVGLVEDKKVVTLSEAENVSFRDDRTRGIIGVAEPCRRANRPTPNGPTPQPLPVREGSRYH